MNTLASTNITTVENTEPAPQPVHIVAEEVPRFDAKDPALLGHLQEQGYVVIRSVLDQAEIEAAEANLWRCLEGSSGLSRADPTTWTPQHLAQIGIPDNGILRGPIGQSDFLWKLRCSPRVIEAFTTIFKTGDLISSMDGGNIFLPWHREGLEAAKTSSGWFHGELLCVREDSCANTITYGTIS